MKRQLALKSCVTINKTDISVYLYDNRYKVSHLTTIYNIEETDVDILREQFTNAKI